MQRREFIGASVLAASGLAVSSAFAQDKAKTSGKLSNLNFVNPDVQKELTSFAELLSRCSLKGQICLHHCEDRLAKGEKEFGPCNTSVQQMVIICDATGKLASMNSVRVKEMLEACINSCQACKDACDEHKAHWAHGMHLDCKDCSEICDKTVAAATKLKKLLAKAT
jgi:Cys-rich four helix bundle protein (predicted Tat secretion target)